VGRETFLKCNFLKLYKIKNHDKWEIEKTKQNYKRVKNKAHNIRRILYLFIFRTSYFLSSKAILVAIDCHSKNWVAVLKRLGSTGLWYIWTSPFMTLFKVGFMVGQCD
jgi:hypothetical protein